MFKLGNHEIRTLQDKQNNRRMLVLRAEFIELENRSPLAGPYFDGNFHDTKRLEALSEADAILLLQIGFVQNINLINTAEFQESHKRGRWYGRRLWLKDRFDKLTDPA